MLEVPLTPEALWACLRILGIAWLLFAGYVYWNWKVYKEIGPHKSPMYGQILDRGTHGIMYGSLVGFVYIVAVGLTCVIFWWFEIADPPPLNTLIVGTVINYILASVVLELWGRHFLKKRGLNPTKKISEELEQKLGKKRRKKGEEEK